MRIRILFCALVLLVAGFSASGQAPPGFELTLFDLDGTNKVVERLPATVYAPRISPGWMAGGTQMRLTGNGNYGISVFDMATRKATKLIDLPGSAQHSSAVSPDGHGMAYASNEAGRDEVSLEG